MTRFKLIVWTRFHAPRDRVWEVCADPAEATAGLPWWVRCEVSDPAGLKAAASSEDGPDGATFATRLRVAGRVVDWPLVLSERVPGLRYTLSGGNRWLPHVEHRRRFEQAVGGHVRVVDELILEVAHRPRRVAVALVGRALSAVHRHWAERLPTDGETVGATRVYRLEGGNLAHAEDPLGHRGTTSADGPA